MTKQYFPLDRDERVQEWMMIISYCIFVVSVWIMLYAAWKHLPYLNVLLPFSFFSMGCYYLIRGWNGITKGNLIAKYIAWNFAQFIKSVFIKKYHFIPKKAATTSAKTLGVLSFFIAATCFFFGFLIIIGD